MDGGSKLLSNGLQLRNFDEWIGLIIWRWNVTFKPHLRSSVANELRLDHGEKTNLVEEEEAEEAEEAEEPTVSQKLESSSIFDPEFRNSGTSLNSIRLELNSCRIL